ncbi:methyltransferase domain-containing protein, partial [bacterium]|nr:methyltransferase domain-containing protein [bacterium]
MTKHLANVPTLPPPEGRLANRHGDPAFSGIDAYDRAWETHGDAWDYLREASPHHATKRLSTRLYMDALAPALAAYPAASRALDAGCGVGRFTRELARRGYRVTALDPCGPALARAMAHAQDEAWGEIDWRYADLSLLDDMAPASFDIALSAEVLNYVTVPADEMARLCRVTRPGGLVTVSVEGALGALAARGADPETIARVVGGDTSLVEDGAAVRLFRAGELDDLMRGAGLKDVRVTGSHFLCEGVLWSSLDDAALAGED